MSNRLAVVVDTSQAKYLRDPLLESESARREWVRELSRRSVRRAAETWDRDGNQHQQHSGTEAVSAVLAALTAAEDEIIE
ncbi:hypothetical protein [Nocardia fluminea]|uniref:hypothetical protein n=1 Tax=Nocardia fluminea TaxID=134984 RepID=UPI003658D629